MTAAFFFIFADNIVVICSHLILAFPAAFQTYSSAYQVKKLYAFFST